ncbi:MAG: hypothetical protein AABY15_02780 [Nanoarchaeota archaeon]
MKELIYTPGEWHLPHFVTNKDRADGCHCAYVLTETCCGAICTIDIDNGKNISEGGNDGPPLEEALGNARLICEAPNMYKLLQKAREEILHLKEEYKDAGHAVKTLAEIDELMDRLHE